MRRFQVPSANLLEVGYNLGSRTLEVVFRNGAGFVYSYKKVGPLKFVELMTAESIGSYFHDEIKSHPRKYPFTKRKVK